ncbi:MAG: Wzy polymerase domain-containing protein [Rhodoferax sp.]
MKLKSEYLAIVLLAIPWLNPFAPGPSPVAVSWLVALICSALTVLAATLSPRQNLADQAVKAWLVAAAISSCIGLIQYFGLSALLSPLVNRADLGEAYGNLRQRNQFATLTVIGLLGLLWLKTRRKQVSDVTNLPTQSGTRTKRTLQIEPPFTVFAAALFGVANAASSSRTGFLQLLAVVALSWWYGSLSLPTTRRVVFTALLAYAVASIVLPLGLGLELGARGILARLHEGSPACTSRITLWSNVLYLTAQKPLLGWGLGNLDFAHFMTLYPSARFCDILDNAHNLPLHLAVEMGVPAALMFCGVTFWLVWRMQPWREQDPTRQLAWGVLTLISLHSALEYPLWYGPFQMALGICIALLWAPASQGAKLDGKTALAARHLSIGTSFPILTRCVAAMALAVSAYVAWDYHRISQIYLAPAERDETYRTNTLAKIKDSWLFQRQVQFAELTIRALDQDNALRLNTMAHDLLHFSPEARVVEKLIESALLLDKNDEADFFKLRFKAAYPEKFDLWALRRRAASAPSLTP